MRLALLAIPVAITVSTFGQQKPEAAPSGARDDLLWKKLSDRVAEIVERFDGLMGVTIVDLTDDRTILKNADRVVLKRMLRDLADAGQIDRRRKKLHQSGTLPHTLVADITGRNSGGALSCSP